jgi:hypothetical protein
MSVLAALIAIAVVVYVGACLLVGFGSAGTVADFQPSGPAVQHRFRQPPQVVMASYIDAVRATPGMRVAETAGQSILIDARPTPRILAGNFGLVLLCTFNQGEPGTVVMVSPRNKVPFAVLSNHGASFTHADRALRHNAKRHGLDELLPGIHI